MNETMIYIIINMVETKGRRCTCPRKGVSPCLGNDCPIAQRGIPIYHDCTRMTHEERYEAAKLEAAKISKEELFEALI